MRDGLYEAGVARFQPICDVRGISREKGAIFEPSFISVNHLSPQPEYPLRYGKISVFLESFDCSLGADRVCITASVGTASASRSTMEKRPWRRRRRLRRSNSVCARRSIASQRLHLTGQRRECMERGPTLSVLFSFAPYGWPLKPMKIRSACALWQLPAAPPSRTVQCSAASGTRLKQILRCSFHPANTGIG